ncbi:Predicted oxidoreductase [Salipiger thiooxidans]|uniref:Predicted oxidoreductase n=1 Tax=Salipiger thiooxidans TaxID=282683 RepID=A0A1G7DP24_9RHOB|nr:aldo/keto reductase [Salipiger thiooxidans]SDE53251.1 Predicted oxidoreductase [Salipiger thiooxidans]
MAREQNDPAKIAEARAIALAGKRRIGLGCMALTGIYGAVGREQAVATITAALDNGVTLFDTAPLYGNGANETLLGEVLCGLPNATIVTKFGLYSDAGGSLYRDSRPEAIRQSVEASLRRLKRDRIDLLLQHRSDPDTPDDDVQACIEDLISAGKVGEFGLSSVSADQIAGRPVAHTLGAVQNELSLVTGQKMEEVAAAMARGACFMAFSPLGRGILTGSKPSQPDDLRTSMVAFAQRSTSGHPHRDGYGVEMEVGELVAARRALAWVLAQGANVVAIPGCRSPSQVSVIFDDLDGLTTVRALNIEDKISQKTSV